MDSSSYIMSFAEGVLTFISPCILPMLPVYFFYLAGVSGEGGPLNNGEPQKQNTGKLILNSIAFVAGFTLVFVLLGATATTIGYFLKSHIEIFRKISGAIMVVFGLNFTGVLKIGFLQFEKRFEYNFKNTGFLSSVIFGIVFGFGWTPCLGAFLGSALLMASNSDTVFEGILLLFVFSAGLGIPFIASAAALEKARGLFRNIQRYNRIINIVSGIVLILAGVLVYTDNFKYIGVSF